MLLSNRTISREARRAIRSSPSGGIASRDGKGKAHCNVRTSRVAPAAYFDQPGIADNGHASTPFCRAAQHEPCSPPHSTFTLRRIRPPLRDCTCPGKNPASGCGILNCFPLRPARVRRNGPASRGRPQKRPPGRSFNEPASRPSPPLPPNGRASCPPSALRRPGRPAPGSARFIPPARAPAGS